MAKDIVKETMKEMLTIADEASKGVNAEDIAVDPLGQEDVKDEKIVEEKKQDEPIVDEVEVEDDDGQDDGQDDDAEFNVSDEVVESAIKAGMSYSDILKLNDEDMISRMANLSINKTVDKKEDAPKADEPMDLSFLDIEDIFEMEDPAAVFTGLKGIISGLADQISTLKTQRQQDVLIDGTSEMMSKLKPEQQVKVREKMDVLSKGYSQSGVKASASDIFNEASKLALGDTLSKDAINKLTNRSKKTIQRVPGKKGIKVKRALTEEEAHESVLAKMEKKMDGFAK